MCGPAKCGKDLSSMNTPQTSRLELLAALGDAIRMMSHRTVLMHQSIAQSLGLNATDHKCLDFVVRSKALLAAGDLARLTGLTSGAITGVIDRLEAAGFVRRDADPEDRRRVVLMPDRELIERVMGPIFASLGRSMSALCATYGDEELRLLLGFVQQATATCVEETLKLSAPRVGG